MIIHQCAFGNATILGNSQDTCKIKTFSESGGYAPRPPLPDSPITCSLKPWYHHASMASYATGSNSISNAKIHLKGYTLYRHDRKHSVGGVLLYVHKSLRTIMCEGLINFLIDGV